MSNVLAYKGYFAPVEFDAEQHVLTGGCPARRRVRGQNWATSLNSGSFSEQMPCAIGQRVWKRQPVGGSSGDGGSPARMMRLRVFWISGSGTGTADSSDCVYGW